MRNTFAVIGFTVVAFLATGWYLGWYKLSFNKSADGNLQIKTDVDTSKVGSDSAEMMKNVGAVVSDQVNKVGKDGKAPAAMPGPVAPPQAAPNAPTGPVTPAYHVTPADGDVYPGPAAPTPPRGIKLIAPK